MCLGVRKREPLRQGGVIIAKFYRTASRQKTYHGIPLLPRSHLNPLVTTTHLIAYAPDSDNSAPISPRGLNSELPAGCDSPGLSCLPERAIQSWPTEEGTRRWQRWGARIVITICMLYTCEGTKAYRIVEINPLYRVAPWCCLGEMGDNARTVTLSV